MKGQFDTRDKLQAFLSPLQSAATIMHENGVILNAVVADKNVQMFSLNNEVGTLIHLIYNKELFDGFTFGDTDEKIGVLKLAEFIKYLSVIDDDGVNINYQNNKLTLSHNSEALSFKTADPDMIKEAGKTFKSSGITWFTEIEVDKRFTKLLKAMSVLANEDCVFISGDKDKGKVTFTVKSSTVDINNFTFEVDAKVSSNFESPYLKEVLQLVLATSSEKIKLSISERLALFECTNKYSTMKFFVGKKVSK
jgi:hypothetical protein